MHSRRIADSAGFADSGLSIGTLLGALQAGKPPAELPDDAIVGLGSRDFGTLVTALSRDDRNNLPSAPSLLTLGNQKAEVLVGQNMPFQIGNYTTNANGSSNPLATVEHKNIGVTPKVAPHIDEDHMLHLGIEQGISSIASAAILAAKAVDLVTNERLIKNTVLADDGQVIILDGLIQDDPLHSDSRVPLLGDIPGVGRLFHSSRETRVKRNLVVFLRPSIVRDTTGLERIGHGRYRSIQLLRGAAGEPIRLLSEDAGAIGLRPAAQVAPAPISSSHSYLAPVPVLMERPRLADPASLGDGRGGKVLEVHQDTHAPQPLSPQRYAVRLVEGSDGAFMRALIEQRSGLSLYLCCELRDGQELFAVERGGHPDPEQARRALAKLSGSLPRGKVRVIARTPGSAL